MKPSTCILLASVLQYAQATQPTAFTQSRCLTSYASKSGIATTTTTAYTLTFYQPVVYTSTPSTTVTPAATTSKYSCLRTMHSIASSFCLSRAVHDPIRSFFGLFSICNGTSCYSSMDMADVSNAAATTTATIFSTSTLPAPTSTTTFTETTSTTGKLKKVKTSNGC